MARKEKKTSVRGGNNSIVIGGDVQGGNIVIGNHNQISNNSVIDVNRLFDEIKKKVDEDRALDQQAKAEIQADLDEMQTELERPEPDVTFLARRVNNIKKMAPDIAEVAIETLKNPLSGIAELIKKVAKKASEVAG